MDLVYPVRPGDNEELRFSLRSTEGLTDGRRWMIGEPPSWVAAPIIGSLKAGSPSSTTHAHLLAACRDVGVSDPFVLMNDDFHRLDPDATVPDWHRGPVRRLGARLLRRHGRPRAGTYVTGMLHVAQRLRDSEGIDDPVSFEYHAPLLVHKDLMLYALNQTVAHKRTYYGNIAARAGLLTPTEHEDVLILGRGDVDPSWPWCATTDVSWRRSEAAARVRALYPEPCRFEGDR